MISFRHFPNFKTLHYFLHTFHSEWKKALVHSKYQALLYQKYCFLKVISSIAIQKLKKALEPFHKMGQKILNFLTILEKSLRFLRNRHDKLTKWQTVKLTDWQSADRSLRLLISIGQKSGESIDTSTSMFTLRSADNN